MLLVPVLPAAAEEVTWQELSQPFPESQAVMAAVQGGSALEALPAESMILVEQGTGKVLFEKNADEPMPPASITKIMSLLLVMEALDSGKIALTDEVTCSEHAAGMGGSQIWLEPGETMTVEELLKASAIASANDAIVALGEHLAGSEEAFVEQMNRRAAQLGMENTHFVNATGLDAEGHLTTARDISAMARELLRHDRIVEYSTVWMDSLRGGETQLVNTKKLVRYYEGCTGLKTGTTDGAGSCLAASAAREGLSLVAVSLGSATSADRFDSCRGLLDYGFANFTTCQVPDVSDQLARIPVRGGVLEDLLPVADQAPAVVVPKDQADQVTQQVTLSEGLTAPVEAGQTVGRVEIYLGEELLGQYPVLSPLEIPAMDWAHALKMVFSGALRLK